MNINLQQLISDNDSGSYRIFDQLPVPLCLKDREGRYVFCNRAFEVFTRRRREEILGHRIAELAPSSLADMLEKGDADVLANGSHLSLEEDVSEYAGRLCHAIIYKSPLRSETGEIEGLAVVVFDVTEARETEQKLREQSQVDPLTGVSNRRGGVDRLLRMRNRSIRENSAFAALMVDIDHFKSVNDKFGHAAGDDVLRQLADRLRSELRDYDLCVRYGGEEFLLALPGVHQAGALEIAERIRQRVAHLPFLVRDHVQLDVTVSLGVSCFPDHGWRLEDLVHAADLALYRAKSEGRNRVCVAERHPQSQRTRETSGKVVALTNRQESVQ